MKAPGARRDLDPPLLPAPAPELRLPPALLELPLALLGAARRRERPRAAATASPISSSLWPCTKMICAPASCSLRCQAPEPPLAAVPLLLPCWPVPLPLPCWPARGVLCLAADPPSRELTRH